MGGSRGDTLEGAANFPRQQKGGKRTVPPGEEEGEEKPRQTKGR